MLEDGKLIRSSAEQLVKKNVKERRTKKRAETFSAWKRKKTMIEKKKKKPQQKKIKWDEVKDKVDGS